MATVQTCCPMPASQRLSNEPQFFRPFTNPVSPAEFDSAGVAFSKTSLGFEDVTRMGQQRHGVPRQRRLDLPEWSCNCTALRKVLVAYLWRRALRPHDDNGGTLTELRAAQRHLEAQVPRWTEQLDQRCRAFVAATDPQERKKLQVHIRTIDGRLRDIQRGPSMVAAIAHHYWSLQMDACQVAELLHVRATLVRQILFRLRRTAAALGYN